MACLARTRTGEPGAAAAVALILMAPSLVPAAARRVSTFPTSGGAGLSSNTVWWTVLALCITAFAVSVNGQLLPHRQPFTTVTSRGRSARTPCRRHRPVSPGQLHFCRWSPTVSDVGHIVPAHNRDEAWGRTPMTYIAVSGLSHVGLVRDNNEDSLVIGPWTLCGTETDSPQTLVFPVGTPVVVAVADGLGGHPGGDLASSLVVRLLARAGPSLGGEDAIREVLQECNHAVYAAAADDPRLATMGTTVAGLVVTEEQVLGFNVGDSRVYRVGTEGIEQVSVDDRPSGGMLSRHTVLQTLGGNRELSSIEPHVTGSPLSAGACYLVCSDGLSDVVPTDELARILHQHEDGRAAFELWKAAIDGGGPDNITLAVARLAD